MLAERDAADVEPVFYKGPQRQVEQLGSVLQRLAHRFPVDQIVVLSMRSDAASCAAAVGESIQGIRLAPFKAEKDEQQCIRFASVHSFKGLESAAVVLTDIEDLDDEQAKSLLYVGMTRARLALVLIMADRVRKRYDSLLMEGYKATRKDSHS